MTADGVGRLLGAGAPVPPTDVQLVTHAGDRIPVDCVYAGMEDGMHRWEVVEPEGGFTDIARIHVGRFPANTRLTGPMPGPPGRGEGG